MKKYIIILTLLSFSANAQEQKLSNDKPIVINPTKEQEIEILENSIKNLNLSVRQYEARKAQLLQQEKQKKIEEIRKIMRTYNIRSSDLY